VNARILVVEDDFLIASAIDAALQDAGYEVAGVASSCEEALELAVKSRPELAIMDIRLEGRRDGIDTALELFARNGIRSVFATAHQSREARERAQAGRPLAWLSKPYSMQSLIATISAAVREVRGAD